MAKSTEGGWASAVVVGSITAIAMTAEWLPHQVAGHFAISGLANGFVARELYVAVLVGSALLLPALIAGALWLAVNHYPDGLNLPNRDYWLAPARRAATTAYLTARAAWLAALLALLALGLHLLVLRANHLAPARLDPASLAALVAAFAAALTAWLGDLNRHFERV